MESLGSAVLDLDADLKPLDAGLKAAEARTAAWVSTMQAMLDSVHANLDLKTSEIDAAAARLAAATPKAGASGGQTVINESSSSRQSSPGGSVWGVRGPEHAGSATNPLVVVLEASKYTNLGAQAAAIGEDSAADSQRTGSSPLADTADLAALRSEIANLSQTLSPMSRLAQEGQNGIANPVLNVPTGTSSPNTGVEAESAVALQQAADALSKISGGVTTRERTVLAASPTVTRVIRSSGPAGPGSTDAELAAALSRAGQPSPSIAPTPRLSYAYDMQAQAEADAAAAKKAFSQTLSPTSEVTSEQRAAALAQREAALAELAAAKAETKAAQEEAAQIGATAGGGGKGGDGRPPVAFGAGAPGGDGGGGRNGGRPPGSRIMRTPFGGKRNEPDSGDSPFTLANLFKGDEGRGGAFGLPGFGSIGSLAGLGLEHWILSGVGVAASAGSAVGAAGVLGTASLTRSLVGGGSDALINKDTLTQAKDLYTNVQALNKAIAVYGKGSKEAAAAQYDLNQQWQQLGGGQGKQAIENLDSAAEALQRLFDVDSGGARVQSADLYEQVLQLGTAYVPLITAAAQRNLGIMNTSLRPLFSWLEGPQGMGVFDQLENAFAKNLPTAMHAVDMGIEDFLRLMAAASNAGGGLTKDVDNWLTDKNRESVEQYDAEVAKLVGDLHLWGQFIKALGVDLGGIFSADAGTAPAIVSELTTELQRLGDWEQSTGGISQLDNVFAVHKTEILQLIGLLPDLVKGYGSFYLDVAPPLVSSLTDIAKAVEAVTSAVEKLPGGADLIGLAIVMGKLGILGPSLRGTATALGLMTAAEGKNAPVAGTDAVANAGLDASLGAGGAARGVESAVAGGEGAAASGGLSSLLGRFGPTAMGGALASKAAGGLASGELGEAAVATTLAPLTTGLVSGGLGIFGGSIAQKLTGLRGGTADTLLGGGAGAGIGAALGTVFDPISGPLGTIIGAGIGATLGPTVGHLLSGLFGSGSGESYGKTFADGFTKQFQGVVSTSDLVEMHQQVQVAANSYQQVASDPAHRMLTESGRAAALNGQASLGAMTGSSPAQIEAAAEKLGETTAQAFITGYSKVRAPSTSGLIGSVTAQLNMLPAAARDAAAQTMIAYAEKLQQEGALPKTAVKQLLQAIQGQFPAVTRYLASQGEQQDSALASAYKFTQAQATVRTSLKSIVATFGTEFEDGITLNPNANGSKLVEQISNAMTALQSVVKTSTGQAKTDAENSLASLTSQVPTYFSTMVTNATTQMQALTGAVAKGSSGAAQAVLQGFQNIDTNISSAMANGLVSTQQGAKLINGALNSLMKSYGGKQIPFDLSVGAAQAKAEVTAPPNQMIGPVLSIGTGGDKQTFATGGLTQIGRPGDAGRDSVPLNVGGHDIVVAPGEQVAVFNRHQLPIVNRALAGYGGLPGLFSAVSTPHYMASGGLVNTPQVSGSDTTLKSIIQNGLNLATTDANKVVEKLIGSTAGGGGISTAGLSGSLIQIVDQISRKKGWNPSDWLKVISKESGGSMTAQNPGSGAYGIAQFINGPSEYAEYGGNVNTLAGQLVAMANYIAGRYGTPTAAWAHEMSDNWYASGGIVPVAGVSAESQTVNGKSDGITPLSGTDLSASYLNGLLSKIKANVGKFDGLLGADVNSGQAGSLTEQISFQTGMWGISNPLLGDDASGYIVSTDPLGNSIAPYINQPAVNLSLSELNQELGWEKTSVADLKSGLAIASSTTPIIKQAIATRQAQIAQQKQTLQNKIAAAKAKVNANLKQIAALQKQITTLQNNVASEQAKKKPNRAQIAAWTKSINDKQGQISSLEAENRKLGGDETDLGSGGQIATWSSDIGNLADDGTLSTLNSQLTTFEGYPATIAGVSGVGGLLGPDEIQVATLKSQIAGLSPSALQAALAQATNSYSTNSTAATSNAGDDSSLDGSTSSDDASILQSLLEQQNTQLAEQFAVSQAQYAVLANMPPFGGSFSKGGIVPGPVGAAATIVAHGGETIRNPGQEAALAGGKGHSVAVRIEHAAGTEKFVRAIVTNETDKAAKRARRPRASQRAGMLTLRSS